MPVFGVDMLARVRDDALGPEQLAAWLLGLFGATTLLLSVVGIWAVVSQSVADRRQEIAIRLALGATRGRVVGAELRRGGVVLALSVPVATLLTLTAERAIGSALFGFGGVSMAPAAVAATLVGAAAFVATFVPAWRAATLSTIAR
jgi:ABC-type antimicrobial peptide transport system permease subunit